MSSYRDQETGPNDLDRLSNERTSLLEPPTYCCGNTARRRLTNCWRATFSLLTCNYVNFLIVFVPLGIISGILEWSAITVFILNFLAIVPLAALICYTVEEISFYIGPIMGVLVNTTFGNAVEVIVSVIALQKNEIRVVQATMLGSIFCSVLLALGSCFLLGSSRLQGQSYNQSVTSLMASLLTVAAGSLIIPTAFYNSFDGSSISPTDNASILFLSRGASIVLLILYFFYLLFQLKTRTGLFGEELAEEAQDSKTPFLSALGYTLILLFATVLVTVCAEYLVDSIDGIVETTTISKTFIGLIMLPIAASAAHSVNAIMVAMRDQMELAIVLVIGAGLQVAIFVTPLTVVVGWLIDRDMSLLFQNFET